MAFVAGRTTVLGGAGNVTLPVASDASGNAPTFTLYSHGMVTAGAGAVSIGYDGAAAVVNVPANGTVPFAIPPAAQVMNVGAAATVSLGQHL